jgi:hypothetical protein
MKWKRVGAAFLVTAALQISAVPGSAWDLTTHWRLTDQAVNNALNASTGLAGYLTDVGIQKTDTFNPAARTNPERLAGFE